MGTPAGSSGLDADEPVPQSHRPSRRNLVPINIMLGWCRESLDGKVILVGPLGPDAIGGPRGITRASPLSMKIEDRPCRGDIP